MPVDVLLQINPPIGLGLRWWGLVALLALLALAVMAIGILRWLSLGRAPVAAVDTSLTDLRSDALARISLSAANFHSGETPAQEACQQIGRTARWFAGMASDGDADYETAAQLGNAARRDPRLQEVATFVTDIQDDCFSAGARPDVDAVATRAEEVIRLWH